MLLFFLRNRLIAPCIQFKDFGVIIFQVGYLVIFSNPWGKFDIYRACMYSSHWFLVKVIKLDLPFSPTAAKFLECIISFEFHVMTQSTLAVYSFGPSIGVSRLLTFSVNLFNLDFKPLCPLCKLSVFLSIFISRAWVQSH